jgi:general secretion pathway protein I
MIKRKYQQYQQQSGFSLIEVLVALAIVAIALLALSGQFASQAKTFEASRDRVLAHWVAQNHLASMRAFGSWPELGETSRLTTFADRQWLVKQVITATPNSAIRQMDIYIAYEQGKNLAHLESFLSQSDL